VSGPLAGKCARSFFCFSLRTHLLLDATIRAAAVLVAFSQAEEKVMRDLERIELSPAEIDTILAEALRSELVRIIGRQDTAHTRSDDEIDARIAALEAEVSALRRAARRNDVALVDDWCREAAEAVAVAVPEEMPPTLGRKALHLKADIATLEARVEDGEDALRLAQPLVAPFSKASVEEFVKRPVLLSQAFDKALALQTKASMLPGMRAARALFLEFLGDIPVTLLTKDRQKAAFARIARLPIHHGRRHGKNRYKSEGTVIGKQEEIERADAADELLTEEVRAKELSVHEKRHLLAQMLTPRMTLRTLEKHRDVLNRVVRVAHEEFGLADEPRIIGYRDLQTVIEADRKDDDLYLRVMRPKDRIPWTPDRIRQLLTSPIYAGCASAYWRWRPGKMIIRDATYWVPLLILTMGLRVAEAVQLKRTKLVRHDEVLCLAIGEDLDQRVKNDPSRRYVPIPQILLDLGFVEWIRGLSAAHGNFLFPEALDRGSPEDPAGAFGSHLRHLFSRLDLADFNEDLYALRKTLSTALNDKLVGDGFRQAILGHQNGTIVNRHYTAQKAALLKTCLDRADFEVEVTLSHAHGFPVITGCALGGAEVYVAELTLDAAGDAETITIFAHGSSVPCFESRVLGTGGADSASGICAVPALPPAEIGARINQIVGTGLLKAPSGARKRELVEHLRALA
jgi:integrase